MFAAQLSNGQAATAARNADEDAGDAEEGHDEGLDNLEVERRRLMARNRAKLMALGISVGVMELQDLAKQHKASRAHHRPHKPQQGGPPAEPTRRSTRLAGGVAGAQAEGGELVQLGEHGEAEAQEEGAERSRLAEPHGLTEEEIAARAEELRTKQAARLRELELAGLVDFSPESAVFVVIGSTGNHYTVRLSDAKRSCQCMDCRIRKRDCKHIRLILTKLQIDDKPSEWYQAVERSFHASGTAAAGQSPSRPAPKGGPEEPAAAIEAEESRGAYGAGSSKTTRKRKAGSKGRGAAAAAPGTRAAKRKQQGPEDQPLSSEDKAPEQSVVEPKEGAGGGVSGGLTGGSTRPRRQGQRGR